ncbi:hypothetical protein [Spirobacillus cienkowskii]|uniref:hypothetical protein n=1 Tax=Spirobacillus cienkowskii TaxID=495820 RepID=UPI0030D2E6E6
MLLKLKVKVSRFFLYMIAICLHFSSAVVFAAADVTIKSDKWNTAIKDLTDKIRDMSPTFFLLGLVFLLATAGAWIWFPKIRQQTRWVWGSIMLIIVVYFVGSYFADPIKNTFEAVLDPIKWISPKTNP